VDDSLIAHDIDSEFLTESMRNSFLSQSEWIHTMVSDLSSYGSLSSPSGLSRPSLTSLIKIYAQTMSKYNLSCKGIAVAHLGVLLPDLSMLSTQDLGVEITIVLSGDGAGIGLAADVTRWLLVRLMCFTKESALSGYKGMRLAGVVAAIAVVVTVVGA
jgi:hypothetical protein